MRRVNILCVMYLAIAWPATANGQQPAEGAPGGPLLLTIAVDLDAPATELIFEARNTSDKDVMTAELGIHSNWIEVVTPDHKIISLQVAKLGVRPTTILKPGESKAWRCDLATALKFDVVGRYRVTWHIEDMSPARLGSGKAEIVLVKSKQNDDAVKE